ncbi:hypothetical protein ABPG74_015392 [Tetrahymena malaccensis]
MKYFNFILYDETINENIQLFSKTITKKNEILSRMQAKIIDLDSLQQQIKEFLSMKQKLEDTIILLSKLNMNSKEFKVILNHFSHCLAFDRKEILELKKQMLKQYKLENLQATSELIESIDSSNNQDSCVIFTSLLNNEGRHVIKKASSNFQNMFHIKCKSVVQKPIEYLMPEVFKPYHSIYIKDFMERNIKFNYQIQNIAFAKDNYNYIFPCTLVLKINSIDSIQDFGITAQIKGINKHKDYILFNSTSMRIISMTQNLHKIIFKHFKQLENINLSQYFPFIHEAINPTGKIFSQSLSSFSLSSAEENLQTGSSQDEESFEQNAFLNKPIQFIFLELIDRYFYHSNLQKKELLNNIEFYLMEIVVKKSQYKHINNLYYIEISQIQLLDPFLNPLLIMYHLDTELYSNLKYSKNELIQNVKIQLKEVSQQLNSDEQIQFHQELNQSIYNDSKSSKKIKKSKDSDESSSSSSSSSSSPNSQTKSEKSIPKATQENKNTNTNQVYTIKVNSIDSSEKIKNKQEYRKSFLSLKFEASQEQILNFRKNKTSSLSEINKKNDNQEEIHFNAGIQQSQIIEEIFTPKSISSQQQNNQTSFIGLTERQNSSSPKQINYDMETNSQFDQSKLLSSPRSQTDKFVQIVQDHKLKSFIKKKFQTILSKVKHTQDQFYQKQTKSSKPSFITDFIQEDFIKEKTIINQDEENSQKGSDNAVLNQRRDIQFIREAMKGKLHIKTNNISYLMLVISYITMVVITVGDEQYFENGQFKHSCRNWIILEIIVE